MDLNTRIKEKLETSETLRSNNPLLWAVIARDICRENNITDINEFLFKVVVGEIPNSHSVSAGLSIVRKQHPELRPDEEGRERQLQIREQYIQNWRNS